VKRPRGKFSSVPGEVERKGKRMVYEIDVTVEEDLHLAHELLKQAGLQGRLRLLIQPGEIRILPEATSDPQEVLDRLAGSLGQEPVSEYNFGLKIGGLYEAR
jgi:hypothetical protein